MRLTSASIPALCIEAPKMTEVARKARIPALPLLIAISTYAVVTVAILIISWRTADRHFIYALDDTYINMAMAKNFALHGVWGITPYEFTSSTSSPLFVLLLSLLYRIFGPIQWIPLILSWTFGLLSILMAEKILRRYVNRIWTMFALLAVVLFTPLFVIGVIGMEHTLHLLLTLAFLYLFDSGPEWKLAIVTALMVAARYEGLFIAAAGCMILAVSREWKRFVTVAIAALFPVAIYGAISVKEGSYWLPDSVALKGLQTHVHNFGGMVHDLELTVFSNGLGGPHLFFLLMALVTAFFCLLRSKSGTSRMLFIVSTATVLHFFTASIGAVFRYEDYLIAAGIIAIACSSSEWKTFSRNGRDMLIIFVFITGIFLLWRGVLAAALMPAYSKAIYSQQWQMARFLKAHYPTASIAANDIGAIDFKTNIHCLDLVGLANSDVFFAKRNGEYSTQFIQREAEKRGVKIAILYDSWFSLHRTIRIGGPPLPSTWTRVARWSIPEKYQEGGRTVSFYSLNASGTAYLRKSLKQFQRTLPAEVSVSP